MSTRFSSQLTEATAYLRAWQALKRPNIKRNEYLIRHWLVDVGVTMREHSTITNALASAGSCEEPIFGHQNPISLSFLLLFLCMKAIIRNRKKWALPQTKLLSKSGGWILLYIIIVWLWNWRWRPLILANTNRVYEITSKWALPQTKLLAKSGGCILLYIIMVWLWK